MEPSSQRFIYEFECGEPFMREGEIDKISNIEKELIDSLFVLESGETLHLLWL